MKIKTKKKKLTGLYCEPTGKKGKLSKGIKKRKPPKRIFNKFPKWTFVKYIKEQIFLINI